jgi:hypothetical protein
MSGIVPDRLEFRFKWDKSEHRRFFRALQRGVYRRKKSRLFLKILIGVALVVTIASALTGGTDLMGALPFLVGVTVWVGLDTWGLAYLNARAYEKNHAACIPNDQVRVLSHDGLTAQCTTSNSSVQWSTPACAIQLPKRSVGDPEQVRTWLRRTADDKGLPNMALA